MGRTKKEINEEDYGQVERLAAVLSCEQIAHVLGMCERTFRKRREEDPDLDAAYKKGKAGALAKVAGSLLQQALNGNTTAAIFYLKTQGKWSEKYEIEHSGPEPIVIRTITDA
ncbi:MAG: hypothetical protein VW547_01170 [Alphaproteobacteria bacterium]